MDSNLLFTSALGLQAPWQVTDVRFEPEQGEIYLLRPIEKCPILAGDADPKLTQVFNSTLPTYQAGEQGDHYGNDWEDQADALPRWPVAASDREAHRNFT